MEYLAVFLLVLGMYFFLWDRTEAVFNEKNGELEEVGASKYPAWVLRAAVCISSAIITVLYAVVYNGLLLLQSLV